MSSTMKFIGLVGLLVGLPMAAANTQSCYIDCMGGKVHGEATHRLCIQQCFNGWPAPSGFVTSIKPFLISSVHNTTAPATTSAAPTFTEDDQGFHPDEVSTVTIHHTLPTFLTAHAPKRTFQSKPSLNSSGAFPGLFSGPGPVSIPTTHEPVPTLNPDLVSSILSKFNVTSVDSPASTSTTFLDGPIPVSTGAGRISIHTGPGPVSIPVSSLPFTSGHGPAAVSVPVAQDALADARTTSRGALSFFEAPSSMPIKTAPGPVSIPPSYEVPSSVAVPAFSKASFTSSQGPVMSAVNWNVTSDQSYTSCTMDCSKAEGSDQVTKECLEKCNEIPHGPIGWLAPPLQDGPLDEEHVPAVTLSARAPVQQPSGIPESEILRICHVACPLSNDPDYITCMVMCQDAWSQVQRGIKGPVTSASVTIVISPPEATVSVAAKQQLFEDSEDAGDAEDAADDDSADSADSEHDDLPESVFHQCYNQCSYPDPVAGNHPELCINICFENWIKNHPFGTSTSPPVPEVTKLAAKDTLKKNPYAPYYDNEWKVCCNRILTCENTCVKWPMENRDNNCIWKCWHLPSLSKPECQGLDLYGQCKDQNPNIINP